MDNVTGFTGGGQRNGGFMFVSLKPLEERKVSADQVVARLRLKTAQVAGANLFLQSGAGHPRRRAPEQRRSTSSRCRPTSWTRCAHGRRACTARCSTCPSSPT